jgi:hypothetical protein
MVEMTISIGKEKRRNPRLIPLRTTISYIDHGDSPLTFGNKSDTAATSIAIPDVKRLYISSVDLKCETEVDLPDDCQILEKT